MSATIIRPVDTKKAEIQRIFKLQEANQYNVGNSTVKERKTKLSNMLDTVMKYRPELKEALHKDYRKHPSEVDLTEVYPVTSEIKEAKSNLGRWMSPKRVGTPLSMMGSSSHIHYQPKGVVLIISPWNFPFNLTFGPLVSAIAAGNTVMIKPSEHTPHTSALMKKIINELFDENEVALVEGGVDTSQALLDLPFNHIFFTGAPSIGKIVMQAASKHLTSVTLELGGKSPTIVDETANLDSAAKRIAWGKFINNGQVCIAPDYLFVHESKKDEFIKLVTKHIKALYTEDASKESSYARIVNDRHYHRIKDYIDDAVDRGAKVEVGGTTDEKQDYISPTVMTNVDMNAKVMQEEIFGPILPIHTYKNINEAIDIINSRDIPLALYIYSSSNKNIKHILKNTRAGGTCVNNNAVHFFNGNLPFGGANNSGIGKGHGWFGFEAFSNARAVYRQHIPGALELLMPPYTNFKQNLIDLTIKWF